MDSSTLLRRTPAGDAEAAVPASGLSLTQRRILTLLETPNRLADLAMGPALDPDRLHREAARLAEAGLIAFDASEMAKGVVAANAADVAPVKSRPARGSLVAIAGLMTVATGWAGLHFMSPAAEPERPRAIAAPKAVLAPVAPLPAPDPKVIATRVLRSDPRSAAPATRSTTDAAAAAPAPTPHTESRVDAPSPPLHKN